MPNTSANKTIPQTTLANIPEEYLTNGARYADRRGRSGGMAELGNIFGASNKTEVLYPATSKLHGALLASLITTPELDVDYVQRFQHIAILAQLADALISVAQATGKSIVPTDFDPDSYVSPEDCSCGKCTQKRKKAAAAAAIVARAAQNGTKTGTETAVSESYASPASSIEEEKSSGDSSCNDCRTSEISIEPFDPESKDIDGSGNFISTEKAYSTLEKRKSVQNSIYGCIDLDINGQGGTFTRKSSIAIHSLPTPPETPAVDASAAHADTNGILGNVAGSHGHGVDA
ncbi:hypothetical protein DFH27DRAFT_65161 [Peziza echinospora]|nr:hypothetical protein DFH27DRAFT_65161 [Peziza echinospora]